MVKKYLFTCALGLMTTFTFVQAQVTETSVKVFPNPSNTGFIEIQTTTPVQSLLVVNSLGQAVVYEDMSKFNNKLDGYILNDLPVDAYVVIIRTPDQVIHKRVMVIK